MIRRFLLVLFILQPSTGGEARAQSGEQALAILDVEQIVKGFTETVQLDRFEQNFQMFYKFEFWYGPQRADDTFGECSHQYKAPMYRTENYFKANPPYTYIAIFNGKSQANLRDNPTGSQIFVRRNRSDRDPMADNCYFQALCIPFRPDEREDYKQGRFPFLSSITGGNGYSVDRNLETVDRAPCHVVRKGDQHVLWFDCRDRVKLVKRQINSLSPPFQTTDFLFGPDRPDGLPESLQRNEHSPTKDRAKPGPDSFVVRYSLDSLSFDPPPDSAFVLAAKPGMVVVDTATRLKFTVQEFGTNPYEDLFNVSTGTLSTGSGVKKFLLMGLVAILLIGVALLLRARSARVSPS